MPETAKTIQIYFRFKKHCNEAYSNAHTNLTDNFATHLNRDEIYSTDAEGNISVIQDPITEIRRQVTQIIHKDSVMEEGTDSDAVMNDIKLKVETMGMNARMRNGNNVTFRSASDLSRTFDVMQDG